MTPIVPPPPHTQIHNCRTSSAAKWGGAGVNGNRLSLQVLRVCASTQRERVSADATKQDDWSTKNGSGHSTARVWCKWFKCPLKVAFYWRDTGTREWQWYSVLLTFTVDIVFISISSGCGSCWREEWSTENGGPVQPAASQTARDSDKGIHWSSHKGEIHVELMHVHVHVHFIMWVTELCKLSSISFPFHVPPYMLVACTVYSIRLLCPLHYTHSSITSLAPLQSSAQSLSRPATLPPSSPVSTVTTTPYSLHRNSASYLLTLFPVRASLEHTCGYCSA